jgi:regulator of nucleoside diphosphate kinase
MHTILITVDDYQRLLARMNFVPSVANLSVLEAELYNTLRAATTISQQNIPKRVVTMNSRARLRELSTQKEIELTITYPENSNSLELKVSIFSEIGVALIGRKIGDQISWRIPKGIGRFEIIDIPFQPEAVGEYSL